MFFAGERRAEFSRHAPSGGHEEESFFSFRVAAARGLEDGIGNGLRFIEDHEQMAGGPAMPAFEFVGVVGGEADGAGSVRGVEVGVVDFPAFAEPGAIVADGLPELFLDLAIDAGGGDDFAAGKGVAMP